MRCRYLDDFRRGISVFAIFSYGIAVLGTPQCPPLSDKITTSKNAQRKRNTQRQISTASTTAQHPRNLLLLGPLHYQEPPDAIKWLKKIITRNVSRLFLLT